MTEKKKRKPDDEQLVAAFLDRVADLSQLEVEARVPGVLQTDVSRWRRDDWTWLSGKKRRAIRAYLDRRNGSRYEREHMRTAMEMAASIMEQGAQELRKKARNPGEIPRLPMVRVQVEPVEDAAS